MTINFNDGLSNKKITANRYTLNYISILASEAADKFEREGADAMASEAREFANYIYNELEKSGMYKNCGK